MSKDKILESEGWRYISSLRPVERFTALFGSSKSAIEKAYNVTIEKRNFTDLSTIDKDYVTLSVTDSFMNQSLIAVLIPKL